MYWRGVIVIEARERLANMQIAAYPWAKKTAQESLHRNAHQQAFPVVHSDAPITLEELNTRMGAMING
jgi:hypothetical protein